MSTVRAHIPQFFGLLQILIACLSLLPNCRQDSTVARYAFDGVG